MIKGGWHSLHAQPYKALRNEGTSTQFDMQLRSLCNPHCTEMAGRLGGRVLLPAAKAGHGVTIVLHKLVG